MKIAVVVHGQVIGTIESWSPTLQTPAKCYELPDKEYEPFVGGTLEVTYRMLTLPERMAASDDPLGVLSKAIEFGEAWVADHQCSFEGDAVKVEVVP